MRFDLKWGTYKNYRLSTTAAATTTTTTTHNQQPTTNNQQPPTTNHQPPTTNHQPPTTNHHHHHHQQQQQPVSGDVKRKAPPSMAIDRTRHAAPGSLPWTDCCFCWAPGASAGKRAHQKKNIPKPPKKYYSNQKKKVVSPTAATFFTDLSEVCCEAKRWKHLLRNPVEPDLALH